MDEEIYEWSDRDNEREINTTSRNGSNRLRLREKRRRPHRMGFDPKVHACKKVVASRNQTLSMNESILGLTTSADSTATSVPPPTAMPTSAVARAGASLIPSPIIATAFPSA